MDAFGLALALSSSFGMHILNAGHTIAAPSGATVAIACCVPEAVVSAAGIMTLNEQVYIVTKGNSCRFSIPGVDESSYKVWSWGDQNSNVNVIYLG